MKNENIMKKKEKETSGHRETLKYNAKPDWAP
jgi:hypothetical protein